MAISVGTINTKVEFTASPAGTTNNTSQTVDVPGTTGLLVCLISARRTTTATGQVTSVTLDPAGGDEAAFTLAQRDNTDTFPMAEVWYLKAVDIPAAGGTYTVAVNCTNGTSGRAVQVLNLSGVDQTTVHRTGDYTYNAAGTNISVTLTTVAGDLCIECNAVGDDHPAGGGDPSADWDPAAGQTELYGFASAVRAVTYGASYESATGTSTAMSWSELPTTENVVIAGVPFIPAAIPTPTGLIYVAGNQSINRASLW